MIRAMYWLLALSWLIAANIAAILAFSIDKQRARDGAWRIAETMLLSLAFVGGSAGAVWARHRSRHKTRKQPFTSQLDLIVMIHCGVVAGLVAALWW